jgi:AcrR family transcriptional regulator
MDIGGEPRLEPDRRQRIVRAAFELFAERGYGGTSTLEIASRARVSKRDLYALFGDKAAILTACIAERAYLMSEPLRSPVPRDRAALEAALEAFGVTLLRELSRPSTVATYRLAIAEAERAPDVARTLEAAGQASVQRAAVDLLAASIAAGLLAGDAAALAEQLFDALRVNRLLLRLLLRLGDPPDEAEIAARARAAARVVLSSAVSD